MVTYAWYLFDPETGKYHIGMDRGVSFLNAGLAEWVDEADRIRVVGFSQGGYLAPFFAKEQAKVEQIIGIGCRYRSEILDERYHFRFDAIHGTEDQGVELEHSKQCHAEIMKRGNRGEYRVIEGLRHDVNSAVVEQVQELLLAQ